MVTSRHQYKTGGRPEGRPLAALYRPASVLYQLALALLSAFHLPTADPKVCYDATCSTGARKWVEPKMESA